MVKNMDLNELLQANIIELEKIAADNGIDLKKNATKIDILLKILPYILTRQTMTNLIQFCKAQHIEVNKSLNKDDLVDFINNEIFKRMRDFETNKIDLSDFANLKYGRTCIIQSRDSSDIRAYIICPNCGEELYAAFPSNTEKKKILSAFKQCPNCKSKISFEGNGRVEDKEKLNINKIFNELRSDSENKIKLLYEKKCDDYIDNLTKDKSHSKNADTLKLSSIDDLKQYLLHLINVESEIYLTKEYLTDIQLKIIDNDKRLNRAKGILNDKITKSDKVKAYEITGEIEKLEDQINNPDKYISIQVDNIALTIAEPKQPTKPRKVNLKKPIKPIEPDYKKVNFFNRKKALLANEQLKTEYEKNLAAYNIKLQKYNDEQKQYETDLLNYEFAKKQYEQDFNKYIIEKRQAIDKYIVERRNKFLQDKRNLLDEKTKERKLLLNSANVVAAYESKLPQSQVKQFLANEQKAIKNELKKIVETRNELYDYNIVYGKYRNYVALTALYEYLTSARCESLEGVNGAYNLYESELRSNEIINQLSKIVTSLDSIKANQFMLYQELRKANDILSDLSVSIDNAVYELNFCNSNLQELGDTLNFMAVNNLITAVASIETAKNSSVIAHNSAVIAHNSAIAAHYSKVNADMTCALGFVRALK